MKTSKIANESSKIKMAITRLEIRLAQNLPITKAGKCCHNCSVNNVDHGCTCTVETMPSDVKVGDTVLHCGFIYNVETIEIRDGKAGTLPVYVISGKYFRPGCMFTNRVNVWMWEHTISNFQGNDLRTLSVVSK
jgi:hypothetical protein